MDDDFWREFARRFDPYGMIPADQMDALYARRPTAPSDTIVEELALASRQAPPRLVLAGPRGTGKSTELVRVLQTMGGVTQDFVPIYVDVAAAMPTDQVSTLVWLPLLGIAARGALQAWGEAGGPIGRSALARALEKYEVAADVVAELSTYVGAAAKWAGPTGEIVVAGVSGGAKASGALARFARTRLNGPVGNEDAPKAQAVVDAVSEQLERLLTHTGRQPVLLVDGLDKRPDLESVFVALQDAELLLSLPAAIVLSGPIQLRHDTRFASLVMPGRFKPIVLHNLQVIHDEGADARGVDVLREVFAHRAALRDGVAFTDLVTEPALERLAVQSSGVVREFLELVRRAGLAARRRGSSAVDDADLDAAITARRHDYELTLRDEDWDELARVLRTRRPPRGDVDRLVFQNIVACYQNEDVWYRPNELLVPAVRRMVPEEPS